MSGSRTLTEWMEFTVKADSGNPVVVYVLDGDDGFHVECDVACLSASEVGRAIEEARCWLTDWMGLMFMTTVYRPSSVAAGPPEFSVLVRLLPADIRDRQRREWHDHLDNERESGGVAGRARRSILLRSVVPIAIGSRVRRPAPRVTRPAWVRRDHSPVPPGRRRDPGWWAFEAFITVTAWIESAIRYVAAWLRWRAEPPPWDAREKASARRDPPNG